MLDLKERTRAKFKQLTERKLQDPGDTIEEVVLSHGQHKSLPLEEEDVLHGQKPRPLEEVILSRRPRPLEEDVLSHIPKPRPYKEVGFLHEPQHLPRHKAPPQDSESSDKETSHQRRMPRSSHFQDSEQSAPERGSKKASSRPSHKQRRITEAEDVASLDAPKEEVIIDPRKLISGPITAQAARALPRPKTSHHSRRKSSDQESCPETDSCPEEEDYRPSKLPRSSVKLQSLKDPKKPSRPRTSPQDYQKPISPAVSKPSREKAAIHLPQSSSARAASHGHGHRQLHKYPGAKDGTESSSSESPLEDQSSRIPRSATFVRSSEAESKRAEHHSPLHRSDTFIKKAERESLSGRTSRLPRILRRGETFNKQTEPPQEDAVDKDSEDPSPRHLPARTLQRRGTFIKFAEIEDNFPQAKSNHPKPQRLEDVDKKEILRDQELDVEPTRDVEVKAHRSALASMGPSSYSRQERRRKKAAESSKEDQVERRVERLPERKSKVKIDEEHSPRKDQSESEVSDNDEEVKSSQLKETKATKSHQESSRLKISRHLDNLKERLSYFKKETFKSGSSKETPVRGSSVNASDESSQTSDLESSLQPDEDTKKTKETSAPKEKASRASTSSERKKKSKKQPKKRSKSKEKAREDETLEEYCKERKRDKLEKKKKRRKALKEEVWKKAMAGLKDLINDPLLEEGIVGVDIHKTDLLWTVPIIQPRVRVHIVSLEDGASILEGEEPLVTQPAKPGSTLRCEWEEILFFHLPFTKILTEEAVILFHLTDQSGIEDTEYFLIAWAFLKVRPQPAILNVNQLCRLQLYLPPPRNHLGVKENLEMICHLGKCKKYPSSLYVTVRSVVMPPRRSLAKTVEAKEEGEAAMLDPSPPAAPEWGRLPGQACKVPNTLLLTLRPPSLRCMALKFSWSGHRLAVSYEATDAHYISIYSFPQGQQEISFKAQEGLIYYLDWSPPNDAKLLSASADGTVAIWRTDGWKLQTCLPHPTYVYCARFNPRHPHWVLSGAFDQTLRAWRLRGSRFEDYELVQEEAAHSGSINDLCWASSGTILYTADSQGRILVWNCSSLTDAESVRKGVVLILDRAVNVRALSRQAVSSLALVPPGARLLVNARSGRLCLVDIRRELVFKEFREGSGHLQCLLRACVSPCGGLVFSGDEEGELHGWCMATGQPLDQLTEAQFRGPLTAMDFHPLDHALAAASTERYGPVRVWRFCPPQTEQDSAPCVEDPAENLKLMRVVKQLECMLSSGPRHGSVVSPSLRASSPVQHLRPS